MKRIKEVSKVVEEILVNNKDARNSDNLLYAQVCAVYNPEALNMSLGAFLHNQKELGLPPFESVRRSRQKVQSENENLRGSDEVTEERYQNFKAVREFAVS